MDSMTKWAVGGSLVWLVVAVGVIFGTHGAVIGAPNTEGPDASPAAVLGGGCDKS